LRSIPVNRRNYSDDIDKINGMRLTKPGFSENIYNDTLSICVSINYTNYNPMFSISSFYPYLFTVPVED
jgi:hypothetical protein